MALSSAAAAVGSLAAAAPSPRPGVPSRRGCSLNITRHPIASQRLAPAVRSTPLAEPRGRIVVSMAMGRRAIFANNAELEALEKFKQITSVEIPNFIQRDDFIDQLYRWSMNTGEEAVGRSLGMPFKCEPIYIYGEEDEQTLWGWTIAFVKDGDVMCTLFCGFDEDTSKKYRWMGRNLDTGMPEFEGDFEEIAGKNFEIWKLGDKPVDDDTKESIKVFCSELADAINKYYAFGSCWAEDL